MAPIFTILAVLAGCSLVGSFSLIGCPHTLAVRATPQRLRPTPLRALVMRQLYPVGAPLITGNLAVSSVHTLYYELHGKADGAPALFLHGGPGAGCARRHAGFFDPAHYRVVLFDQRGCGKSTPRGSLEGNDTPSLVADCEALRRHLGVERWDLVLGGSWGVTLALAYAARHPTKVSALVLRAVCLMRTKEVLWLFGDRGIGRLIPDGFHAYSSACDTERKQQQQQQQQPSPPNDDGDEGRFLRWYASALREELGKDAMARAAGAWSKWEMSVFGRSSQLPPNRLRDLLDGELCELPADNQPPDLRATWAWSPSAGRWECGGVELPEAAVRTALSEDGFSAHIACALSQQSALPMPPRAGVGGAVERARQFYQRAIEAHVPGGASEDGLTPLSDVAAAAAAAAASRGNASSSSLSSGGGWVPVQARLTSTFSERRAFFASDDELLGLVRAGGASLRRIPCIAVQGGNDIICPPSTAYELHEAWPEMELRVVPAGGHSHYDSGLMAELLRATDAIRDRRHSDTQAEADS